MDRELYSFEVPDAQRVARVVVEMVRAKRIEDAIALARAGVNLAPRLGDAWNTLAYAYSHAEGMEPLQVASAREAVTLSPDDPTAWHNLSLGRLHMFEFDGAMDAALRALALPSSNAYIAMQAAFVAAMLGAHPKALECLEIARSRVGEGMAERDRFLAEIAIAASASYASIGDWQSFCSSLDSRHELSSFKGSFLHTMWTRGRLWSQRLEWPLAYRGIEALVYMEWGLGDQIQFARLIAGVLRQVYEFSRVTIACSASLVRLFRSGVAGVDEVIDQASLNADNIRPEVAVIPVIDLMTDAQRWGMFPLGSWPGRPYIATPAPELDWRPSRQPGKIAIAFGWQGDPNQPQDFSRRVPFREWGKWAELNHSHYTFHSIQTKFAGRISPWEGWPEHVDIDDASPWIRDMRDTAEAISRCDVFVGQCGGCLHLAGALGKPAVALLGASHDFRWDFEPLYEMELVKQSRPGDWASAFAQLDDAIQRAVNRLPADLKKES